MNVATVEEFIQAMHAEHYPVGGYSCGKRSAEPVLIKDLHYPTSHAKPITLVCTEDEGHEGDHRDNIHCYTTHTFTDAEAVQGSKSDRRTCAGCTEGNVWAVSWPCKTERTIQRVLKEFTND